jgi:rod shape determining protein RodA
LFGIDRRIITHFDFVTLGFLLPLIIVSVLLVSEVSEMLATKQVIYISIGFFLFFLFFILPIRKFSWLIPVIYWGNILLLIMVEFFGISKLGAKRWLELPFINFTIQPSEIIKPSFILMLCYLIHSNPPPENGYGFKEFTKISFFILLPFFLIAKEPDLGTALILLLVGFGVLIVVGVDWKIWATIIITLSISAPFLYSNLHDYQKKRILDFMSEKPNYHVQQSIIAIGSGGLYGKDKDDATQAQLKFLPIATSDFIFAYFVERFGFWGACILIINYALLILHLISINFLIRKDHFIKVFTSALSIMLFIYMSVNIAMTLGFAPVVGIPLPLFSYGGSSFVNFMILFGIFENLLAFRFVFMYNSNYKN